MTITTFDGFINWRRDVTSSKSLNIIKNNRFWEVVVAQLVEQLLSIPEVRGSTQVIDKILFSICLLACLLSTVLKRRK